METRELDEYRNGDVGEGGGGAEHSGSEDEDEAASALEAELSLADEAAPARALAALNALRKARQHYDVVLQAGGAELPAHRAVLAAASPHLLAELRDAPATHRVPADVTPDALRELLEYAYTGRLRVRDALAARSLYVAAWRLRVEPVRAHLAARLLRRLAPADCLATRALPGLAAPHLAQLDAYIARHFDEVCAVGALAALPTLRVEMLRATSAAHGEEAPLAVADAALAWLRDSHAADTHLEELCARTHLLYVDARGELRDCGELPAGCDGPELREYRREAAVRARAPPASPAPAAPPAPRSPDDCAVLAARALPAAAGRVTRALLALRGRLVVAHVEWRDVDATEVARGGPLGGAGGGERRARMAAGRCALGAAALGGRLFVCGGYDRACVLRSAEAYDPAADRWAALAALPRARARFPAARLGGAVYALGGSDGHAELDSVDVFEEATGTWRAGPRLPAARSHAAAVADEAAGALYVVGGWAGGRSLRAVHKYEPATNQWTEAPPLTVGRSQCACAVWRGALWALGGCDQWHCLATTETLALGGADGAGGAWTPGPPLPTARRSVGAAAWRGRLVSAGGSDGAASLRRTDWLLPGAAAWAPGPALRRARASLALAVLDDVLYAAGGFDGKEFLACVECLPSPDSEWTSLRDERPPPPAPAPPSVRDEPHPKEEDERPGKVVTLEPILTYY